MSSVLQNDANDANDAKRPRQHQCRAHVFCMVATQHTTVHRGVSTATGGAGPDGGPGPTLAPPAVAVTARGGTGPEKGTWPPPTPRHVLSRDFAGSPLFQHLFLELKAGPTTPGGCAVLT